MRAELSVWIRPQCIDSLKHLNCCLARTLTTEVEIDTLLNSIVRLKRHYLPEANQVSTRCMRGIHIDAS